MACLAGVSGRRPVVVERAAAERGVVGEESVEPFGNITANFGHAAFGIAGICAGIVAIVGGEELVFRAERITASAYSECRTVPSESHRRSLGLGIPDADTCGGE